MRRVFCIIIISLSVNHIFPQSVVFKLSPLFGFSAGNINEFVYKNDIKESHLEWKNYKPFIGIRANCRLQNFILDFKIQSAIPVALGNMTDKDFAVSETSYISLYSKHNLITNLDFTLTKLALQFSMEPYVKAGLTMSVAGVVHAGCGIQFGAKGYVNFGYYNPYLRGSYGLNDTSSIYANIYLGLKGVKILGIRIGDLGHPWDWELLKDKNKTIVPETIFFEYKIN